LVRRGVLGAAAARCYLLLRTLGKLLTVCFWNGAHAGAAARGGSQAMRPFLQRLYKTRAAAYRDSAQQFIDGYKDGFREAMEPARGGILEDDGATGDDKQGAEAAAVVPIAPPPPPPAPEGTASQPPRTPPNDPSSKTL
jgi:hypothetical protein